MNFKVAFLVDLKKMKYADMLTVQNYPPLHEIFNNHLDKEHPELNGIVLIGYFNQLKEEVEVLKDRLNEYDEHWEGE